VLLVFQGDGRTFMIKSKGEVKQAVSGRAISKSSGKAYGEPRFAHAADARRSAAHENNVWKA
jgi:hypothetical protein